MTEGDVKRERYPAPASDAPFHKSIFPTFALNVPLPANTAPAPIQEPPPAPAETAAE